MTKVNGNIIELAKRFKQMEVDHELFQLQFQDGTYYWDIIRYRLYMVILSNFGIYENVSQSSVAYQAIQMEMKVFVFEHDYYKASYDLFDIPNVYLVDDWKKITEKKPNLQLKSFNKSSNVDLFTPFSSEKLTQYN